MLETVITHLQLSLQLLDLVKHLLLGLCIHSHSRSLTHRCSHRGIPHFTTWLATSAFSCAGPRLLAHLCMVILQCLLGCFLLGTLKIDTAQVALAYVVLLYEVAELLVKELANDAIIGDVACLIAKLQALKLALGTLQLSK